MRFKGKADLLHLVVLLSGTRTGLTLREIKDELRVSYRTAQRMLAALRDRFEYMLEDVESDENAKRWRMRSANLRALLDPEPAELMELDAAAKRLRREGAAAGRAEALERLLAKVRRAMQDTSLRRAEPDLEALMQAEGTAVRPGPRHEVAEALLLALRHAILASARMRLRYGADLANARDHVVEPLGLLHGQRPYLVAQIKGSERDPTMFRLDRVHEYGLLAESFRRETPFDLASFAAGSFGVWRDKPVAVCLRFSAGAARDVVAFHFHPRQETEVQDDGSVLVRFTAGGQLEMCHHLLSWGEAVEVLQPPELRGMIADWASRAAAHHAQVPEEQIDGAT